MVRKSRRTKSKRDKKLKKLQEEENQRNLRKERLEAEIQVTTHNMRLVISKWEKILVGIKVEELKKDFQGVLDALERWMTAKSHILQLLFKEFDDNEESILTMTAVHIDAIDKMIEVYLRCIKKEEDLQHKSVIENVLKSQTQRLVQQEKESAALHSLTIRKFRMNERYANKILEHEKQKMETISEQECKHYVRKESLELKLESEIEEGLNKIQTQIKIHSHMNSDLQKNYVALKYKDDAALCEREYQENLIETLTGKIVGLKEQLKDSMETMNIFYHLRSEKQELFKTYCLVRKRNDERDVADKKRLRNLIVLSENAHKNEKKLELLWTKVGHIKKLSSILSLSITELNEEQNQLKDILKQYFIENHRNENLIGIH